MGTLYRLWLPLAVSFELMMLEAPTVQSAVSRLPAPERNLAAFGLAFSLSLILESPALMLIATSIALVKDTQSYRALRRFTLLLCLGSTALTALVAFTPLFDVLAARLMKQPPDLVEAARPAMQIMLLWTAAIAWRRFYQGILVRFGRTQMVTWGTLARLIVTVGSAAALVGWGRLSGAAVGTAALIAAVVTEAVVTTLFALPVIRRDVPLPVASNEPPLTQRAILRFHTPLTLTTLLTFLTQPLTLAALGLLANREVTLAAWPVTYGTLLVLRGWGLALQEITVAQARHAEARPTLRRFAWIVGGVTTGATALLVGTPLLDLYFHHVLNLPVGLRPDVRLGIAICVLLPLMTALGSWARGLLVAAGRTATVYHGMGINLATHGATLALGVGLRLPGIWVAAVAFSLAAIAEYLFLVRRAAESTLMAPTKIFSQAK